MTLTNLPYDPVLDLAPWVGQRKATFRFELYNAVTGYEMGTINPVRTATLSHSTTRTIKRQLSFPLGREDTAAINVVQERIRLFMVFPDGTEWPLGVYMFTDTSREVFTSGRLGEYVLNDEMFLVDQQIESAFTPLTQGNTAEPVAMMVTRLLRDLPITFNLEQSPYDCSQAYPIGTYRGRICEDLAFTGDWFSPWFDNQGVMRWIQAFDPADQVPDFDWDEGNQVLRDGIVETDNLLTAPNVFIITSNSSADNRVPVYGRYEVPPVAPHSRQNRGFLVPQVEDWPVLDSGQASALARNLGIRQTVFETITLSTAPDPRHDSYNVIRWRGENWLELGWSMTLTEGGVMNHTMRKAYRDTTVE
jgi:hypothetical protein